MHANSQELLGRMDIGADSGSSLSKVQHELKFAGKTVPRLLIMIGR
jgi:hypothetical protein